MQSGGRDNGFPSVDGQVAATGGGFRHGGG